jgi:hypothetical protein
MSCLQYPFNIYAGTDEFLNYQATDSTGTVPVDITGYSFNFEARRNPYLPAVINLNQTTFSNAQNGQVSILLSASATVNLWPDKYYFTLSSVDPSGNIVIWQNGTFLLDVGIGYPKVIDSTSCEAAPNDDSIYKPICFIAENSPH